MRYGCLRKRFFAISALSTLLGAQWFHVESRKTSFLTLFTPLKIFSFNSRPKFSLFLNIVFLKFWKLIFLAKFSRKTVISASPAVDKAENAKNNEIKTSVLPSDSLKSLQNYFLRQFPNKNVWYSMKFSKKSRFLCMFKALNFCRRFERRENSNLVKEPGH